MNEKTVIVTGASRGIGRATALLLSSQGFNVIGTYVSSDEAACALEKEAVGKGYNLKMIKADVRNVDEVENLVEKAAESGSVFGLVNNAGITRDNLLIRMTDDQWKDVIETNLTGVFNITRRVVPLMMKNREGSIVNLSSIVGIYGNAGQANYSATKAALIGFTRTLAKELGPRNIRVNAVAPGFIKTDMTEKLSEEIKESVRKMIPLKRFGTEEEVAEVICFLMSPASSYISGAVIEVSGGLIV